MTSINKVQVKNFRPEDYSRFLIREFLKKNGFEKTYDSFILEDTREKVTMTKNELTRLLGIEALMRRNAKSKVFNTMLDILCDFLVLTKDASNGLGVQYPNASGAPSGSIQITQSKIGPSKNDAVNSAQKSKPLESRSNMLPPSANARPQTSGGPGTAGRTQARTQANFFNPSLQSKP